MKGKFFIQNMQNSDPALHSPEQKLRKISFDACQLDQFRIVIKKKQQQMKVDGWGNENWDYKTQEIINKPKSRKSLSRGDNQHIPNNSVRMQFAFKDKFFNDRTKYIEILQEKLVELGQIKTQRSNNLQGKKTDVQTQNYFTNGFNPHYLTPLKFYIQKTTSTSQSESENKCEHNFTSTFYKNNYEKQRSFSIRKKSCEASQNKINVDQLDELNLTQMKHKSKYDDIKKKMFIPYTERNSFNNENRKSKNRSMIESYNGITQRSNQVTIISYPVIDKQRRSKRATKVNKLNQFFQRFQSRNSKSKTQNNSKHLGHSENKKLKISLNQQQQYLFRIKITQPLQNRKKPFRIIE